MSNVPTDSPPTLTTTGRYVILAAAFLGWMFSGVQMTSTSLVSGSATAEFAKAGTLSRERYVNFANLMLFSPAGTGTTDWTEEETQQQKRKWYALYNSLFLLGAATGGLVFGWIGDRAGRVRAMAASILCYSGFAGLGYLVITPEQLLVLRFLCGMGIGGMWPTGVSLAAEAWSDASRPMLSGLLGTSANVGIFLMSYLTYVVPLNAQNWRWVMLVGASSAVLAIAVLLLVPESPAWLRAEQTRDKQPKSGSKLAELFRPPLLRLTLIGIALGTIPVLGGWGVTNWLILWTEDVKGTGDYHARAMTAMMRSGGAIIGGMAGGWIANLVGRRFTYFMISLISFAISEYIYLGLNPKMPAFSSAVFAVGCISTVFYGWLPLYLPELFPTHVRATGSGVSFNTGRILSAAGVLGAGALTVFFQGNFARAGSVTSMIYALGMLIILFAPDTTGKKLT